MMRTACIAFFLGLIFLSTYAQAQNAETKVGGIYINGEEYTNDYHVFILSGNESIEAVRTSSGFMVPNKFAKKQKFSVRFVFDKYDLIFGGIDFSELSLKWVIGVVNKPPFPEAYVSKKKSNNIKRLYYIKFISDDGQQVIQLVTEKKSIF
jgi:hypothetical protein